MKAQIKQHQNSDSCCWEGCSEHGQYPAPKSPNQLNERYNFCLEHVRLYNKSWNFFGSMNQAEIESFYIDSLSGHRPTSRIRPGGVYDTESLREEVFKFRFSSETSKKTPKVADNERDALAILGLNYPVTMAEIKRKYKALAKLYHPDINGNKNEEKLKVINQAYSFLKNNMSSY
ncbi:MAG: molecular chaperone DnaJ [Rickettsiaceae bacterium]|jgi:hypothetical protein|nr:molecular chaperone DnaJ [Rickettsiaceae bacterium]